MRDAIGNKLLTTMPELKDVYEPHAADKDSVKPYAVVLQGEDNEESDWAGFRRIVEVWPYVSRTSFKKIDSLEKKIVAALDKQLLTNEAGEVFSCIYLGTAGQDVVDEDWNAITRGLQFAVMALQPVATPETVADDRWLVALGNWSQSITGQNWQAYRCFWPLGYQRPSVMWRIAGMDVTTGNRGGFVVRKRVVGHVLGVTPNEQLTAALKLVEAMQVAIKLPLDLAARRYMTVVEPRIDLQADAITSGQINVTLTSRTMRPSEDAPLMRRIDFNNNLRWNYE